MGIYVHVPFCRQKCFYCGFYSVASSVLMEEYVGALCREMELRRDYLGDGTPSTLYLGGGTPSMLPAGLLENVVGKVEDTWHLAADAERTLEMNPEDAQPEKLRAFRRLGFNRLSIGVQSFNDGILKRINRRHSGGEAVRAVEAAAQAGFDNIGVDLIIGLPGGSREYMEHDLDVVSRLPISHVSVYILSIDSNTVLERLLEKGRYRPEDEDLLADAYLLVAGYLKDIGFEHYEISNFAKGFKYSRHNTAYWQQKKYIGLGAAAHSYNGDSRQWNVANIQRYIEGVNEGRLLFEKEELTDVDKYNEYIMTRLRTKWGGDAGELERLSPRGWAAAQQALREYVREGFVVCEGRRIRLSEKGWLISDRIFSSLFE